MSTSDNTHWRIKNDHSGKCLNVQGGSTANNARIIQYTCGGASTHNDQWRLSKIWTDPDGPDWYWIVNRKSNKCMGVAGASRAEGADMVQMPCGADAGNTLFTWIRA
jgi:hypothetical protein